MNLFFNKDFYKHSLIYLLPIASSFLFFWKLGDSSFWFDEFATLNTISTPNLMVLLSNYFANHLHPPLYFFILKTYLVMLGVLIEIDQRMFAVIYCNLKFLEITGGFSNFLHLSNYYEHYNFSFSPIYANIMTEAKIRFPSAVFLTAANVLVFDFFKKNKLIMIGIIYCLLIGTNTKLIYYAQEARPYALFILVFILVLREFHQTLGKDLIFSNFRRLIFFNTLLCLTHYYGAFVFLCQILFLAVKNRKNKRFIISTLLLIMSLIFIFIKIYEDLKISKFSFLTQVQIIDIKLMNLNALGYFVDWRIYLVSAAVLAIKKYIKKTSDSDIILCSAFLFLSCLLGVIYFFNLIKPIFDNRYVIFLIPLQILIVTCIYYSNIEFLFLLVNRKGLKSAAISAGFLTFSVPLVGKQINFHFNIFNYYQQQKFYPIKSAYVAIANDIDFKKDTNYILEEHFAKTNFKLYEQRYSLHLIAAIDPNSSTNEKEKKLKEITDEIDYKNIFYIRVRHKETEQKEEALNLEHFSKSIIFKERDVEAYKFTKSITQSK